MDFLSIRAGRLPPKHYSSFYQIIREMHTKNCLSAFLQTGSGGSIIK
jgi:hypothetical protein